MKRMIKRNKGITLIALVVTIVILLILATVSINLAINSNEIFERTRNGVNVYKQAETNEKSQINSTFDIIDQAATGGTGSETPDGSWNDDKGVNSPKLAGTGLHAVSITDDGTAIDVTDYSKWYDYSSQKWANAVTKDNSGNITGYFVWIPRYAYKITKGLGILTAGTIEIKFLKGTSDVDNTGAAISKNYPTVTNNAMDNYVVHPAFTNNVANGGWDSEISGFWVAKYPAGYQGSTLTQNSNKTVSTTIANPINTTTNKLIESGINYTNTSYLSNAVDSTLDTNTAMSYPVFKPLTYAYNCITIGDIYTLSRDIQNASNFYGLSNIDSHLEKNSEWGAVAYLTQSIYGRNGTEVNTNSYDMNNSNTKNTYCVTGLYSDGTSADDVTDITQLKAYNEQTTGIKGSSTGNITGVYDLNGCIWEYVANYITNEHTNLASFGWNNVADNEKIYTTTDVTPQTNERSTRWATAYPYDDAIDSYDNNYTSYNSFKSETYGYGDAILETSTSGSGTTSWNGDCSYFPCSTDPFFVRAGSYCYGPYTGEFCFFDLDGSDFSYGGFRVVLVG